MVRCGNGYNLDRYTEYAMSLITYAFLFFFFANSGR